MAMPPSQILLFDQPRSAAQLLGRILSKQPNLQILDNTFGPARGAQVEWLMGEAWADGMSSDARSAFDRAIEKGVSAWRLALQDCRDKGKTLLLQDHPFSLVSPEKVLKVIHNPSPTESEIVAAGVAAAGGDSGNNIGKSSSDERGKGALCDALLESIDSVNPIPDDLLFASGTIPVLTIRDPRLAVPSAYRVLGALGLPAAAAGPTS
ncbi:hypothetical protein PG997_011949 [Apiospora hydei]|uniref:Uncharacterized protein n=1 Tax=Apiospora hydei TaxID=1337664 RepID=A0ABR1V210_9PEZI